MGSTEIIMLVGAILVLDLIAIAVIFHVKLRQRDIDPEEAMDIYLELDRRHGETTIIGRLTDDRFKEPVAALRDIGFFAASGNLDTPELARQVFRSINMEFANANLFDPLPDRPANWLSIARAYQAPGACSKLELDLLAVGEDTQRVWWEDLNQVQHGNNGYARMLRRWSDISCGSFLPAGITESWGAEGEPVLVSFALGGMEQVFVHLTSYNQQLDTAGLRTADRHERLPVRDRGDERHAQHRHGTPA